MFNKDFPIQSDGDYIDLYIPRRKALSLMPRLGKLLPPDGDGRAYQMKADYIAKEKKLRILLEAKAEIKRDFLEKLMEAL